MAALALVLAIILPAGSTNANATLDSLTNQYRATQGKPALSTSTALTGLAERRSREIVTDFSHHLSALGDSLTSLLGCWEAAGENLIWRSGNYDDSYLTPSALLQGWIDSPEHRANILGPYTIQGSAIYTDPATGNVYGVQEFARPCSTAAPVAPAPKPAPAAPAPKTAPAPAPKSNPVTALPNTAVPPPAP